MRQEKQVLCEIKSTNLQTNFYQFCEAELKGLSILDEIERIKNLTNEEAIDEFNLAWCRKLREKETIDDKYSNNDEELEIFPSGIPNKFSIMEEQEPELP